MVTVCRNLQPRVEVESYRGIYAALWSWPFLIPFKGFENLEEARGRFSHSLLFGDIDLLSALCNDPVVVPIERGPCLRLPELF